MRYLYFLLYPLIFFSDKLHAQQRLIFANDVENVIYNWSIDGTDTPEGTQFPIINEGDEPRSLIEHKGAIYGITRFKGKLNNGTLFRYQYPEDTIETLHHFKRPDNNAEPMNIAISPNDVVYGILENGEVFSYDLTTNVYDSILSVASNIRSGIVLADNGNMYGVTRNGGNWSQGYVFQIDPATKELYIIYEFGADGNSDTDPTGSLMQATDGHLYGVTEEGGTNEEGSIYRINLADSSYTDVYSFDYDSVGGYPWLGDRGSLAQGKDGLLYGSIYTNNSNFLFGFNPATQKLDARVEMDYNTTGEDIERVFRHNNQILVIAGSGGSFENGVISTYNSGVDSLEVKFEFTDNSDIYPWNINDLITINPSKLLIANSNDGIRFESGLLTELDTEADTSINLVDFNKMLKGNYVRGALICTSDNRFFGVTSKGGTYNDGTIFEYFPANDSIEAHFHFKRDSIEYSQATPYLTEGPDGSLYGYVTGNFNNNRSQWLVSFNTKTYTFEFLLEFTSVDGGATNFSPVFDGNILYGAASIGGASNRGGIFSYNLTNGNYQLHHSFTQSIDGWDPTRLIRKGRFLYGFNNGGGQFNRGTIYKFDTVNDTFIKVKDVQNGDPRITRYGWVEHSNGKLYLETVDDFGAILEFNPFNDQVRTIVKFRDIGQRAINSGLGNNYISEGPNGKLWGGHYFVKPSGTRSIYNYDLTTNTFTDFLDGKDYLNSNSVNVTNICVRPTPVNIPSDQVACAGNIFEFALNAENADSYVWKKDGTIFAGGGGSALDKLTINDISLADAGTYSVEMTNACGSSTYTFELRVSDLGVANIGETITDNLCFGVAEGEITIQVDGGIAPLEYRLVGENNEFQSSNTFTGLAAGSYTIIVRDSFSCTTTHDFTISEPTELMLTAEGKELTCLEANDGSIELQAKGGTGSYTYRIDNTTFVAEKTFENLAAGTYTLYVKDENACMASVETTITQPIALDFTSTTQAESCLDKKDGKITINVIGGTSPYQYSIDEKDFQGESGFTNLEAGEYKLSVKDANGCTITKTIELNQVDALAITSTIEPSTNYPENGSITLTVSGGTPPYGYSWSNNDTTATISALIPDTFEVTVTDSADCTLSKSFVVGGVTSIDNTTQEELLKVYPNPAKDQFFVDLPTSLLGSEIKIYDTKARLVLSKKVDKNKVRLDVKDLEAGMYLLKIGNGKAYRFKLQ